MKKKLIAVLLVAALAIGTLAGCSTPTQKEDKQSSSDKVVKYSATDDPPTLDPQLMNSIPSATIGFHIFDGLTRLVDGEVVPAAAEKWDVSEDGLTYTFHLRDGLKWSDGKEVTAEDYVYGAKRLVDPATASEYSFFAAVVKNASAISKGEMAVDELGYKAIDEKTVEITLEHRAPYFLGMLGNASFAPTRKDLVDEYKKDFATDGDKNVYNGPFVVKEWKKNDRVILEKNKEYWDADNIKIDGIEVLTVSDPQTAVAMFENGELDFCDVPQQMYQNYKDQVTPYFDGSNDYLVMNQTGDTPLKNHDLRLAINYALDRDDYIKLMGGVYQANTRYVLPNVAGPEEGKTFGETYPYEAFPSTADADKAKEHLNKALQELGIANPADLNLELLTADTETSKQQAEILQDQIQKNLGITITIKQVPYKQRLQQEADKDFQMVVTGWVPDYNDAYSYLEIWESTSSYNHSSYNNPEYDACLKTAREESDPQKRMDAMFEAEKIFLEDAAIAPLQLRQNQQLRSDRIKGLKTSFVGYQFNLMDVEIVE